MNQAAAGRTVRAATPAPTNPAETTPSATLKASYAKYDEEARMLGKVIEGGKA